MANQLRAGNSQDLIILRELLSAMTAIDPLANLSDTQVAALGGGPNLRGEAIHPTVPVSKPPIAPGTELRTQAPVEKRGIVTKSGPQLVASLEEERMMLPLLVLVAQTRDTCLFTVPDEEAHMKSLSTLFDSVSAFLPSPVRDRPFQVSNAHFVALLLACGRSLPRSCSNTSSSSSRALARNATPS